jgi:hypothetical protein
MSAAGLLIVATKCNQPPREAEWEAWYDDVHLPDLLDGWPAGQGPTVATRWALSRKPEPGMPGLGFSHVAIYELPDEPLAAAERLAARQAQLRADGRVHPTHAVVDVGLFVAHGRWADKPEPSAELRGHILANVFANDPDLEAEWDAWYDAEHIPDMMASEAFAAATRWRREPRRPYGPNHITLYDVTLDSIDEAVARSAAVMPGLIAAGRKHRAHTGALTLTLVPAGRHGGAGYRPLA